MPQRNAEVDGLNAAENRYAAHVAVFRVPLKLSGAEPERQPLSPIFPPAVRLLLCATHQGVEERDDHQDTGRHLTGFEPDQMNPSCSQRQKTVLHFLHAMLNDVPAPFIPEARRDGGHSMSSDMGLFLSFCLPFLFSGAQGRIIIFFPSRVFADDSQDEKLILLPSCRQQERMLLLAFSMSRWMK